MSDLVKIFSEDKLLEFNKMDDFLAILNQEPPESWVKKHPIAKNVEYLPVDKVELLLTKLFQEWHVEILREGQLLNSIFVTVRLHYLHPLKGAIFQDGVAAVPIKTDKGEAPSNLAAIKNDAIQTGLPSAESFALKDAAEKIGKIFGRDLNRSGALDFTPSYSASGESDERAAKKEEAVNSAIAEINSAKSTDELRKVFTKLGPMMANEKIIGAKNKRKEELANANN